MYKKGSWERKKIKASREKADTRDVTAHNYRLWPNAVLPYTIRYPNISKICSFFFQHPGTSSSFFLSDFILCLAISIEYFQKQESLLKKCSRKLFGESILGRTSFVIMGKWVFLSTLFFLKAHPFFESSEMKDFHSFIYCF